MRIAKLAIVCSGGRFVPIQLSDENEDLEGKVLVDIYNPLFELITGGHIVGSHKLKDGISTGMFETIEGLEIKRNNGTTRCIKLYSNKDLYYPDVELKVNPGYKDNLFLTELEKEFYSQFIFYDKNPLCPTKQLDMYW